MLPMLVAASLLTGFPQMLQKRALSGNVALQDAH
jgi:hypothetical protein